MPPFPRRRGNPALEDLRSEYEDGAPSAKRCDQYWGAAHFSRSTSRRNHPSDSPDSGKSNENCDARVIAPQSLSLQGSKPDSFSYSSEYPRALFATTAAASGPLVHSPRRATKLLNNSALFPTGAFRTPLPTGCFTTPALGTVGAASGSVATIHSPEFVPVSRRAASGTRYPHRCAIS